jgi:hypothetical protein
VTERMKLGSHKLSEGKKEQNALRRVKGERIYDRPTTAEIERDMNAHFKTEGYSPIIPGRRWSQW